LARKRVSVRQPATDAGLDTDEVLILLWEGGFDYIISPDDLLPKGETNRARRALGLATRRELASQDYWCQLLGLTPDGLSQLLQSLGVTDAFEGIRLRKKALNRLKGEARQRGLRAVTEAPTAVSKTKPLPLPPLVWSAIGHQRTPRFLSLDQVAAIHVALVDDFRQSSDPIEPAGARSLNLLASAVHRPQTTNGGVSKYLTVEVALGVLRVCSVGNGRYCLERSHCTGTKVGKLTRTP
jgi:hypothetical protein